MRKITNEYYHVADVCVEHGLPIILYNSCNLRCPFCNCPNLLAGEVDNGQLTDEHLEHTILQSGSKRVKITGGEPTMYSTVIWLTRRLKSMGFEIEMETNGLRPSILKQCSIDYLSMNIMAEIDRYDHFLKAPAIVTSRIKESVEIIKSMGDRADIVITMSPGIVDPNTVQTLKRTVAGAKRVFLQRIDPKFMLDKEFFKGKKMHSDQDMVRARNALIPVVESVQIRW